MRSQKTLTLGLVLLSLTLAGGYTGAYAEYESGHPLSDKVGFSVAGKLKDGTQVNYQVKRRQRLSFQILEEVVYRKNGNNVLVDFDADGKVDRLWIAQFDELIGRDLFGLRLRYNKQVFTEAEAREMIHDADRIFNRVKVALKVNEGLASYGKSVENPFR